MSETLLNNKFNTYINRLRYYLVKRLDFLRNSTFRFYIYRRDSLVQFMGGNIVGMWKIFLSSDFISEQSGLHPDVSKVPEIVDRVGQWVVVTLITRNPEAAYTSSNHLLVQEFSSLLLLYFSFSPFPTMKTWKWNVSLYIPVI